MTTATLTLKSPAAAPIVRDAPVKTERARKSLLARFVDMLVETRMRQARREIQHYLQTTASYEVRKNFVEKFGEYDDIGARFVR